MLQMLKMQSPFFFPETVGARIRAEHAYIGVVSVTIVDNEFRHLSRQCTLSTPTDITEIIYENACRLFDLTWNHVPIRLLGVSSAHATDTAFHQMNLFDETVLNGHVF